MHGSHGRASVYLLLTIECIERFVWLSWFQTLVLRKVDTGPILLFNYTLPMAIAPLVSRIGAGVVLTTALAAYALAFFASSATSSLWLVVAASALYKSSLGPTLKERGTGTDFARLYLVINLGAAVGSFTYSAIIHRLGISGFDVICGCMLMVAAALSLPFFSVRGAQSKATAQSSWSRLLVLSACLLPLLTAYWLFIAHYRIATLTMFEQAGLPSGSLMGALCLWVMIWSAVCTHPKMSPVLQQGTPLIFCGGIVYALFYVLLGLTHQSGMATPWLVILECGLFTLAEAMCGAVMQRLLMERAPTSTIGASTFFALMGLAGWLASRVSAVIPVVPESRILFWAAAIVLLTPALMLSLSRRFDHV